MIQLFEHFINGITLYLVFPGLLLLGLYLSVRLRLVQVTKLFSGFTTIFKKQENKEGSISHYQAVSSVLASNFGTGNISGMAMALTMGGPGALVWMWIMTFLGSAVQFANCLLGVKYSHKNEKGEYVGGAMYYLTKGLGLKKTALLFSIAVILAAFCAGNFVQVNSITLPFEGMGIAPWISGGVLTLLVGIVVLGGAQRIVRVCSAVVPVMAVLYFGAAVFILGRFHEQLLPMLQLVAKAAFSPASFLGGTVGFSVMKALTAGFDRAIFATDAGTGTVPLLQSGAQAKHPAIDGLVSLVAPVCVMVICSATVLVLMVTGAWYGGLQSTNMVTHAFNLGLGWGNLGNYIVLISLFLFGYTTTIAWATCLQRAVDFIFGSRLVLPFLLLYTLLTPLGALINVDFAWILADISLISMLIINLIAVTGLSKEVIGDARSFFKAELEISAS